MERGKNKDSVPRQTLYRMRSVANELLYVGITSRRLNRFDQHASTKEWWREVHHIDIEHFDTRPQVEAAEKNAIKNEAPKYNIVHNGGRGQRNFGKGGFTERDEWAPANAPIAGITHRGGYYHEAHLWLQYEVDYSSMFGEWDRDDRDDAVRHYIRHALDGYFRDDSEIRIYWLLEPISEVVFSDEGFNEPSDTWLDYYHIQLSGMRLDMESLPLLPVAPSPNSSLGMGPLCWRPAPLQRTVSKNLLRAAFRASNWAT